MNATSIGYVDAQRSRNFELVQIYLDLTFNKHPPAFIESVVAHTPDGEGIKNYANVLVDVQYLTKEGRDDLIERSFKSLEDKPLLIMSTPKVVAAQFPLRIICGLKAFDAPTENHFMNYVVDNYMFMAKQIFECFYLPNGKLVNSVSSRTMDTKMLNDFLYFSGYRNQLGEMPRRKITDQATYLDVEEKTRSLLESVSQHFPEQKKNLQNSIDKICRK